MKGTTFCLILSWIVSCGISKGWAQSGPRTIGGDRNAPVQITLLDQAHRVGSAVRIGDLVEMTGGDLATRNRIAALELPIDEQPSGAAAVSRSELLAQILLAGVDSDKFILRGYSEVQLFAVDQSSVEQAVVQAIQRHISAGLNIDERTVKVRLELTASQLDQIAKVSNYPKFQLLEHADRLIGRRLVELAVSGGHGPMLEIKIAATTSLIARVVVTSPPDRNRGNDRRSKFVCRRTRDCSFRQPIGATGRPAW